MADVVGQVAQEVQGDIKPMLDGKGEETVVTVHNPLTSDFSVQYARSLTTKRPESESERFAREKAGLAMEKDMGQQQAHSVQFMVLKAGETKNLPGDIAQVAVRQLVNYILGVRGGSGAKLMADMHARQEVEKEIIIKITDSTTFMNELNETTEQAIDKLNPAETPSAKQSTTSTESS